MSNTNSLQDATGRVKREVFTPLGKIYYKEAEQWQRMKIETEALKELGVKRHSIRAYMVSTPASRMNAKLKDLILRTLPQAADCFQDPTLANLKASFSFN
ncbi:hypothetical protein [Dyadobacter sp. CY323]|uniref:hypothetical protein n=1 Tax=Dyadobacter sp. CY323 TaxID=2907302 RepID=UPI001F48740F|nr:hypothetical protein [Dyadobacter sp. CY323]MCE6987462.1 hypothetical protein [Dyadobacter sp. CY323]